MDNDQQHPPDPAPPGGSTERIRIIGAAPAGAQPEPDDAPPGQGGEPPDGIEASGPSAVSEDEPLALFRRAGNGEADDPAGRNEGDAAMVSSIFAGITGGRRADTGEAPAVVRDSGEHPSAGSGRLELPHWTQPPTGQVPQILIDASRDEESWSAFGASPRWRDQQSDWEAEDYSDVAELGDDEDRLGALDTRERPSAQEFFTFDDLDDLVEGPGAAAGAAQPDPAGETAAPAAPAGRRRTAPPTPPPALARPESAGRNLPQAAAVGAALFLTAVLAFRAGPAWSMVLVAVVLAVAAAEFFNSARLSGRRPATLLGIASAVALPLAVYWKGTGAYPVVLFLTVVVGLLWYVLGVEPAHNAVEGLGLTLLGVAYVGGLGSFAALILSSGHGGDVLLAAVIATVAYDIGGYVVGRNAGRSKLSDISPNKTVEGLFGGCVLAVLTSVLVSGALLGLEPFDRLRDAALLGLVAAVAAPLGDLAESLLKRDFGVKDMGSVLPGHGGVLDRFDALLFVLPAVYYLGRVLSLLPA